MHYDDVARYPQKIDNSPQVKITGERWNRTRRVKVKGLRGFDEIDTKQEIRMARSLNSKNPSYAL